MARFSRPTRVFHGIVGRKFVDNHPDVTTNYEGAVAFRLSPEWELYQLVSTCLVDEPKFYKEVDEQTGRIVAQNQDHRIIELIAIVAKKRPEFILQLASYCRNTLNLRSISSVLLGEAALVAETKQFVEKWTPTIIVRADDLTEVIAYLQVKLGDFGNMGKKGVVVPHALRRGLAKAFKKFDEHQLAKYDRLGKGVKLRDVLSLVHPKPDNAEQSDLWKRLIEKRLAIPDTWEEYIMNHGDSKESWEHILPKMPIFATVRNLRNLLKHEVSKQLLDEYVVGRLSDEKRVKGSRMLPFRFLSALKIVEELSNVNASKIIGALETAMELAVKNLPRIGGISAIFADASGSMTQEAIAKMSSVYPAEIARLMLSIARNISEDAITGMFADTYKTVNINPNNGILGNAKYLSSVQVGSSTNGYLTVDHLTENNIHADRIILFTDGQLWDSHMGGGYVQNYGYAAQSHTHRYQNGRTMMEALRDYQSKVNRNVYYYEINLAGYGTVNVPSDYPRAVLIAGWSERILEFISKFEEDSSTALDKILTLKPFEHKEMVKTVNKKVKKKITKATKKVKRMVARSASGKFGKKILKKKKAK